MSETGFFNNRCEKCGGGIEFPANGAGEQIQCPHCQQPTTLTFPVVSESNPTEQLGAYLAASAFPKNRDELRLLSKFISPTEMGKPSQLEYWQTIIKNPLEVIERFLSEGFIQETNPDVAELLQCTKSSAELKALAKERGIGESGTKQVLAERLVKADPAGMSEFFRGRKFLTCSPKGRILADKFRESEKYAESHAEKLCFEALSQLRFEDARFLAKNYFSTGGLPAAAENKKIDAKPKLKPTYIVTAKGVLPKGTDIEEYEAEQAKAACLNFLNLIFTTKLLRHARFNQETMRAIQISAAMMELWGTNKPPRWMVESYRGADFDLEFEARMLEFTASHFVRIQSAKEAGISTIKIIGQDDPDVCPICRSDSEKIYPVDSCPILPHENCTCDGGCSCMFASNASFDEGTEEDDK
jgi:hypothetical protein